ncbi:hypothetical protein LV84_02400 [Algoriphagus ratkowskyi]|uniref:Uncharacterized protein n=1 Tax=Algoriphagus ratkowskyi TaxID=57028 RepID=A0A2W7R6E4_9BACT|nr:hypothetical protein [Algoriphagus ratkowskyi]PZX56034.1 hypothetical protein LV84_02400 [Algoriphagus ratkowskyi]TXD77157.1 hypothetical protein ESW18_12730 [Algoriphagus ratkowskyi]
MENSPYKGQVCLDSTVLSTALVFLIIFVKKQITLDHSQLVAAFRENGILHLKEGNGKVITLMKPEQWKSDMGDDWTFLLFDLFQIRLICQQFSEVSLDIIEYANKPTVYHSPANSIVKNGPIIDGVLKFSLVMEPSWNKLLFQISQPVLVKIDTKETTTHQTPLLFPLLSPSAKEMYLGPDGDVKIIKG